MRIVPLEKRSVDVGFEFANRVVIGVPFYVDGRSYCVTECRKCARVSIRQTSHLKTQAHPCACRRRKERRLPQVRGQYQYDADANGRRLPEVDGVEFRTVPDLNGYAIGSDGSLWTCQNRGWPNPLPWRRMKPAPNQCGYLLTVVCMPVGRKTMAIHRLVARAFHGPCPAGKEVRHLDGDCKNNAASNLCYGTKSENTFDAMRHGRHPNLRSGGEGSAHAKLNNETVSRIRELAKSGMNCGQIRRLLKLPVNRTTIQKVVKGSTWRASV